MLVVGLDFLQRSRFIYHGALTSYSCLITGKWELKITDYGLGIIRQSQIHPTVSQVLKKNHYFGNNNDQARILTNFQNLLWTAPETIDRTPIGVYISSPTVQGDMYR